jgi:hypothetical protein
LNKDSFNFDVDVKANMTLPEPHQLIEKVMRYEPHNGKDFTKSHWTFACLMWPNLGWDMKQAEQALEQLLLEGKIMELETGHYEPTERLSKREDS